MTTISGPLVVVTERPAIIDMVEVRATTTRPHGTGLMVDNADQVDPVNGAISFECAPGPALITLISAGHRMQSTRIVAADSDSQTLADAVRAGAVADGKDLTALEELEARFASVVQQVSASAAAASDSAAAADVSARAAKVSETNSKTSETRAKTSETTSTEASAAAIAGIEVLFDARVQAHHLNLTNPTQATIDSTLAAMPAGSTVMNLTTGEVWGK